MDILITGGAGFIGSHLVDLLLEDTTNTVTVYDDFSTGTYDNLSHIESTRLEIVQGDIRDKNHVHEITEQVDIIYHLAAAVGVHKVVDEPLASFETNIEGTKHLIESATQHDIPIFIASSSEVFGKSNSLPLEEDTDRNLGPTTVPRWSYATAKAADEILALGYAEQHDLQAVIGRFFNIVGPRQTGQYGMVIPRFVSQAIANEPLTVYDDGTQTRSFTHVHDTVEVLRELMHTEAAYGEVINIGAPERTSINDLAHQIIEITGSESNIVHKPLTEVYGDDFEEPKHREPSVQKLETILGWTPSTDLDRIIKDIIAERKEEV